MFNYIHELNSNSSRFCIRCNFNCPNQQGNFLRYLLSRQYQGRHGLYLSTKFSDEQIVTELSDPLNHFYWLMQAMHWRVISSSKTMATPVWVRMPALEVSRFYAHKNFHGKGVGKAMMDACIAAATKMQKQWLWLVVWKQNPRAIQFYRSAGFSICAEAIFVLGEDVQHDWVMKRSIP